MLELPSWWIRGLDLFGGSGVRDLLFRTEEEFESLTEVSCVIFLGLVNGLFTVLLKSDLSE